MSRNQSRRSISIPGTVYDALQARCRVTGLTACGYVTRLLERDLADVNGTVRAAELAAQAQAAQRDRQARERLQRVEREIRATELRATRYPEPEPPAIDIDDATFTRLCEAQVQAKRRDGRTIELGQLLDDGIVRFLESVNA